MSELTINIMQTGYIVCVLSVLVIGFRSKHYNVSDTEKYIEVALFISSLIITVLTSLIVIWS